MAAPIPAGSTVCFTGGLVCTAEGERLTRAGDKSLAEQAGLRAAQRMSTLAIRQGAEGVRARGPGDRRVCVLASDRGTRVLGRDVPAQPLRRRRPASMESR